MSMELMDEHEQGERVRAWLRENGTSIVTGIALGIAAIGGWQWWGASQRGHALEASTQYAALVSAVESGERDLVEGVARALGQEYRKTPYAALGALSWADLQLESGETAAAVETLEAARAAASDPLLAELLSTRLARARLAAGEPEKALQLLEGASRGSALDARGDVLVALGRPDEAKQAYLAARDALDENLPTRRIIELKLLDLGVKPDDEAQG